MTIWPFRLIITVGLLWTPLTLLNADDGVGTKRSFDKGLWIRVFETEPRHGDDWVGDQITDDLLHENLSESISTVEVVHVQDVVFDTPGDDGRTVKKKRKDYFVRIRLGGDAYRHLVHAETLLGAREKKRLPRRDGWLHLAGSSLGRMSQVRVDHDGRTASVRARVSEQRLLHLLDHVKKPWSSTDLGRDWDTGKLED